MSGSFQSGPFRTGSSQGSMVETILSGLNEARGTAYSTEPGTAVYIENLALAKCLADAWETARRFANQFDPTRTTSYLSRWENILGIVPSSTASDNERRRALSAKWALFNVVPTDQATQDFLKILMPSIYAGIRHATSASGGGSIPGGATITGGATLLNDSWRSPISQAIIRVVEPTSMSDAEFYETVGAFKPFMDDFLPAHMTYDWGRYGLDAGLITLAAADSTVYGTGTLFLTGYGGAVAVGEEIEVYDDSGVIRTITVIATGTETTLTSTPVPVSITLQPFKRFGFFLDTNQNLDNQFFT